MEEAFQPYVHPTPEVFLPALVPGAPGPLTEKAFNTMEEIILQHFADLLGKGSIMDFLIGLQIPAQGPAIQIAGTDAAPLVTQQHLGMGKARLKLEYSDPMAE